MTQEKIAKRNLLEPQKKYSFPLRSIDTWNGLKEEVIMAKNVQQLKERPDKYRYRDDLILRRKGEVRYLRVQKKNL